MFRKLVCILMTAVMLAGLCGCTLVSRVVADGSDVPERAKFVAESLHVPAPVPEEVPEETEASENGGEAEGETEAGTEYPQIKEDDPMYGDVSAVLEGIIPIFSYFAFKGEDMDLTALSADDFWLLMAMISAQVDAEHKDADGSLSVDKDVIKDYAATFFGDYYNANGLPDWKGTVSASSEPRSKSITLSAMTVDGYHGRMVGFEPRAGQEGLYDLYLEVYWSVIEGAQTGTDISEALLWKVTLEPWTEDGGHAFAFRMKSYEPVESGDTQEESGALIPEETKENEEGSAN